ncbi:MAG: multifunctional CCA addition/repair protein [Proteobacteria bacterium]|nr:multifunctional CCA addition/repair protein [Pseudomonadota bacterium]
MKTYLVGGAVRDELLNLPIKERDYVVVGGSINEMMAQNFTPVGKFFPVFLHPDTKEEYALARIERKVQGGYHGFTFDTANTVTLEQDLLRRDLTINAMAKDEKGNIIDPYGGQKDLKEKWLRHVSDAFVEDPVRVLRVARFAARFAPLGFKVAPETISLMKKMGQSGELDFLVPERVCKELLKALEEPMPVAFIQVLRQSEALKYILPEINALYGVPQDEKHHPEKDTGIHVELVLNQATRLTEDPQVRFAALLHDVGKGTTPKENWPEHPHHEQRGEEIAIGLCERLRVSNEYQALARLVVRYHGEVHRAQVSSAEDILQLFEKTDAFRRPERFAQILLACEADFKGRPGYEAKEYKQVTLLRLMFAATQDIDVPGIVKASQGQGEIIKNKIHEARLKAISAFKN